MSWLPDSGWLRALDLRSSTFAAVALGCWAVFSLAEFRLLYLDVLPTWVRVVFVIVALAASLLWLGRIWDLGFANFERWRQRRAILAQLDNLSTSEESLLRGQLEKNEQTFLTQIDSSTGTGLRNKGLAQPSSNGYALSWPHTIPDFVWAEMKRRWKAAAQPGTRLEDIRSRVRRARGGHRP